MAGFSFGLAINSLSIDMTSIIMTSFFILSGFSLFMTNSNYNLFSKEGIIHFYKKRIISIIPLYFFVHFVYIFFYETDVVKSLLLMPVELLGLQTIFPVVFGVIHNGATWFISCILVSYYLYPFIQELIKLLSAKKRIFITIIMIAFISYLVEISNIYGLGSLYTNPLFRVIEFATGAMLASIKDDVNLTKNEQNNIVSLIIVLLSALILLLSFYKNIVLLLYLKTFIVCIAIIVSTKINLPILDNNRVLQYTSKLTYHFYILQIFIWTPSLNIINQLGLSQWKWSFLIAVLILTTMCIGVHELYEKPIQKKLKKVLKV